MTPKEILLAARERIAKGWATGSYAYNADGYCTNPESESACRFCIEGALMATPLEDREALAAPREALRRALDPEFVAECVNQNQNPLVAFNDRKGRTQDEVLALFDKAVTLVH